MRGSRDIVDCLGTDGNELMLAARLANGGVTMEVTRRQWWVHWGSDVKKDSVLGSLVAKADSLGGGETKRSLSQSSCITVVGKERMREVVMRLQWVNGMGFMVVVWKLVWWI